MDSYIDLWKLLETLKKSHSEPRSVMRERILFNTVRYFRAVIEPSKYSLANAVYKKSRRQLGGRVGGRFGRAKEDARFRLIIPVHRARGKLHQSMSAPPEGSRPASHAHCEFFLSPLSLSFSLYFSSSPSLFAFSFATRTRYKSFTIFRESSSIISSTFVRPLPPPGVRESRQRTSQLEVSNQPFPPLLLGTGRFFHSQYVSLSQTHGAASSTLCASDRYVCA